MAEISHVSLSMSSSLMQDCAELSAQNGFDFLQNLRPMLPSASPSWTAGP
jgi:hypothetical protein